MVKFSNFLLIIILFILLAGIGCVKDQIEQGTKDVVLKQEYSIPVGKKEFTLSEIVGNKLIIAEDTSIIANDQLFFYEDTFYRFSYSPIVFLKSQFLKFDFSSLTDNFESIKYLMFRLNYENEIPAECEIDVLFPDRSGINSNPLFTKKHIIEAAHYEGETIIPFIETKHDIYLDEGMIQSLVDKEEVQVRLSIPIEYPTNEITKFYKNQTLKIQFAIRFGIEKNSNDN